jgi:peptide/nickel transport system ATP-binding protein
MTGPAAKAGDRDGLSIRDLGIGLDRGRDLVTGVSFDVRPGKVMALVGESGSGKTMIGRSVLRLLPDGISPNAGDILYNGESLIAASDNRMRDLRGGSIGMVFQEPLVSLNPAMKIGTQMAEGMRIHTDLSEAEIRHESIEMLRRIRITDPEACLESYPHRFSGGMRQRIMLASVMLLKPGLLIADEPTTALDTLSQLDVLETMIGLAQGQGTSILLITHNLGLVARYADDVIVLQDGETVEAGPAETLLKAPQKAYTRKLLDSVPTLQAGSAPVPEGGDTVLEARNVSLSFGQGFALFGARARKTVLRNVSLSVRHGEIVSVVGGSGSGKTTLGRAMLRLEDIDKGQILFRDQDITRLPDRSLRGFRRACHIVFQDPFSSLNPRMRIETIVAEALRHTPGLSRGDRLTMAQDALESVGLPDHRGRLPHELSGGQRQRVAIARAVVSRPALIVADEPISALDMTIQKQVLELFERLQSELGFACVFISHDLAAVQQIAQRIVVMHEGQIVEEGSCAEVFNNPQHEYTRQLIAASPMLAREYQDPQHEPTKLKGKTA